MVSTTIVSTRIREPQTTRRRLAMATSRATIVWLVAQSLAIRILIVLSAMVVEELFFRSFLQPRAGALAATLCSPRPTGPTPAAPIGFSARGIRTNIWIESKTPWAMMQGRTLP